ncbi:Putative sulfate transporter YbaR [Geodia barretti]|uniref:Sulfate transporter YbaR n=1 Tax=Geodia barretti TaxID=519541 RepID=A0AA35TD65_GEOBA|nr:Putative sulfate transporter YbaR [Geodia barretti]
MRDLSSRLVMRDLLPSGQDSYGILAGLTVSLALVPEAVAFAFVAGVDPLVGMYAAFIVGLITSSPADGQG